MLVLIPYLRANYSSMRQPFYNRARVIGLAMNASRLHPGLVIAQDPGVPFYAGQGFRFTFSSIGDLVGQPLPVKSSTAYYLVLTPAEARQQDIAQAIDKWIAENHIRLVLTVPCEEGASLVYGIKPGVEAPAL